MRKFGLVLLIFLAGIVYDCIGQEHLIDLQTMPNYNVSNKVTKAKSSSKVYLSLPFFDDFSQGNPYPDQENWTDNYVFINQTYAINPPTIGVATFDAIDNKGELYSTLSVTPLTADTLTSRAIDLNYTEFDDLFLSFQYQPKGLGKEPQPTDSLTLEFYSVDDNKWIGIWGASPNFTSNTISEKDKLNKTTKIQKSTSISENFFKVLLPIVDSRFLKTGFKFRFLNYASLSQNQQIPSIRGNGDQWHIDLVYLDKDRFSADTLLNDITFTKPLKSLLKNYEAIPWTHFNESAKQEELTNPLTIDIKYSNLGSTTWNVTRRYGITDASNLSQPYLFSGGAENIFQLQTVSSSRDFEYTFGSNWIDSARFDIESYLITDNDPNTQHLRYNDTIRYTQKFYNYYAYDDGSAENGYGIFGEGSQDGMVAVKFHSYDEDSLKGVMIYFNRTYNNASQQYFKLTVWNDLNGKPGSIVYQKNDIKPIFTSGLNKFTLYSIDDRIKIGGDFWVGWVNTTVDMLNVGFDLNNIHNDKLYYNLNGNWVQSQFEGSLMIRPVFGKLTENPTLVQHPKYNIDFSIYPNPATCTLNFDFPEEYKVELIRIVNLSGQVMISKHPDGTQVDISNIPKGIYLVQAFVNGKISATKKLVVIK